MLDSRSRLSPFLSWSLERPVTVLMLLLSLLVIGAIAFQRIPLKLTPEGITFRSLTVSIPVTESTPDEVLDLVTEPVEEAVRGITGVTAVRSWSRANQSEVEISYSAKVDGDAIYGDVRDRLERLLPSFPEGADRYFIYRFNLDSDLPILQMAATYESTVDDPDTLLEKVIKPKLEGVDGVARAEIYGLVQKRVEIELDPKLVEAYQIDVRVLIDRLRGDNLVAPGGILREGGTRYLLRLNSRYGDFRDIREFPVNGSLTLGDIAKVDYRRALSNFIVRVDGNLCKTVAISKESDANTLATCERILKVVEAEFPKDPRLAGFTFQPYFDQGKIIREAVSGLEESCLWGGLFAVMILFFFLRRVGLTLIVAAAIPLSLVIAVTVIFFQGGTFNILSIAGLTLSIGMLIDNAIVIAENVFRYRQLGHDAKTAATLGVREVGLPITLATMTTVAVFLPISLLGDSQIPVMLREVGLPVCFSVVASLVVAIVFIPIATTLVRPQAKSRGSGPGLLTRGYGALLRRALVDRRLTAFFCLLALLSTIVPAWTFKDKSADDRQTRDIRVRVKTPPHFTLIDTDDLMASLAREFVPLKEELDIENIVCWFSRSGGTLAFFLDSDASTTESEFFATIGPKIPEAPGVRIQLGEQKGEAEKQIRIRAEGRDPQILGDLIDQVAERMEFIEPVLEVRTRSEFSRDEIQVNVQRDRAQRYQVTTSSVAMLVGWALRGAPLNDFQTESNEFATWISYEGSDIENLAELYQVPVYTERGDQVPLANLARFEFAQALPAIRRVNGKVTASIELLAKPNSNINQLGLEAQKIFNSLEVPEGYELVFDRGRAADKEMLTDFMIAILTGFLLIFVIMGVLFESYALPLCVVVSIFFIFMGSNWLLFALGEPLSETAYVGFVILLGVVVNNAIVLVDAINRFRADHEDRLTAIVEAGKVRLRPILMTALTTICGLSPLVVMRHTGEGIDYRPMAIVVMGGLASATFFTLLAVPLAYSYIDDLRRWVWQSPRMLKQSFAGRPPATRAST